VFYFFFFYFYHSLRHCLDSDEYCDILSAQIKRAVPSSLQPKRVWLTAATGSLLKALGRVWPLAQFMVVQVAKKLTEVW
jgi:hypothetical protein